MKENSAKSSSFFGYGVAQHNRPNKALDPYYAKLDDRNTPDILAYAAELSKYVKYYDLENKFDGTWEPFFLSDVSVVIALIISIDVRDFEERANLFSSEFYQNENLDTRLRNYLELRNLNLEIVGLFNHWYSSILKINLSQKRFESVLEAEMFSLCTQKVKPFLHEIIAHSKASRKLDFFKVEHDIEFDHLHAIWDVHAPKTEDIFFGDNDLEKLTSAMLTQRLQFKQLFQTLSFAVIHFKKYFDQSLEQKEDHNPDLALFIGFIEIFKYLQSDYNLISERLQYFYYSNILKMEKLKGTSDFVHVHFDLSEDETRYFIPENTRLLAGLDKEGNDIFYKTVNAVEITQVEISKIHSIFCSRLDDLDTSNYNLISHIYRAPVANSRDGLGLKMENKYDTWPIFGEEQEYKPQDSLNMELAEVGWAFSSPVLHLAEGVRKIKIRLDFIPESTRIFKRLVYDVYNKVNDERAPDEPKKIIKEIFYDRIFNQLDKSRNFHVFLSGSLQWIEVNPNTIAVKAVGEDDWVYDTELPPEENIKALNALEISFTLPVSAPPITFYNATELEGYKFDTEDPIVKFILNDKKQPFVYSFFQSLELEKVNIHVHVNKYKNISIENEDNVITESRNIFPFSMTPKRGSSFNVICPELFRKHLTSVDIHVNWDRIPETVKDFVEHYKTYKDPLHPADLKIQIGAYSNYEVEMDYDEELIFPLFTTTEGDVNINDVTELDKSHFHLNREAINMLQIVPNYYLDDEILDTDDIDTGYFVVELIEPRNALYANIYQNEINEAINKNIEDPKSLAKFPNEPVNPYVRNLYVSYEAEAQFNVSFGDANKVEKIFHIHPFGQETAYENGSPRKKYFLPKYTDDGYLFLGLNNVNAPETISIYFQLSSEETKEQTIKNLPKIQWMYLSENRLIPFEDSKIIFDTTYGFTESGIVKLSLPWAISGRSTIVDSDLSWIVAKVNGDVERLCKAMYIAPHAVLAKWDFEEDLADRLNDPLDANQITDFYQSNSKIREIYQPFESFGGKGPESVKQYNCRVSEIIRHKNRAVTHWDVERIVLNEFPTVLQVKALSHLSDPLDKEGYKKKDYVYADEGENIEYNGIRHDQGIKLVVIPTQQEFKRIKTPKFSLYRLLEIQKFVNQLTSSFMKIDVANPLYEYVRVVANVKFIDNYNNGMTLNRLFDDINKYIAPWLYAEDQDVKIGGSLNENVLQNFIKGLPYVKFLTKFSILHIIEEDGLFKIQDTAMEQDVVSIIQSKPWGVLLPDDHHEIEIVDYEEVEEPLSRVNSDEIIRFQNKVNILGDKKYIKIKNPKNKLEEEEDTKKSDETYNITINI